METPVILIIFRRPDFTARVMDVLAQVKPKRLLVVADGPRADCPEEAEACAATRAVIDRVDWDCEVSKNYSEVNLGCGRRPATGISWAFELVEEAIILEDDCIPHPSFFRYCEELLERYRGDERVMHISGCTYREEGFEIETSYYFSKYPACWGWATWKRAWKHFDYRVQRWPELKETSWLSEILERDEVVRYWAREFDCAHRGGEDLTGWDYQWAFACWAEDGLAIFPRRNLIANVGCGDGATHTFSDDSPTMNLPLFEMDEPLKHPPQVARNHAVDLGYIERILLPGAGGSKPGLFLRVRRFGVRVVKRALRCCGAGARAGKSAAVS